MSDSIFKKFDAAAASYSKIFPDQDREIGTLLSTKGVDDAIRILKFAVKRGKKIEVGDAGETDQNEILIGGETV